MTTIASQVKDAVSLLKRLTVVLQRKPSTSVRPNSPFGGRPQRAGPSQGGAGGAGGAGGRGGRGGRDGEKRGERSGPGTAAPRFGEADGGLALTFAGAIIARLVETLERNDDDAKQRSIVDSLPRLVPKGASDTAVAAGIRELLLPMFREASAGGLARADRFVILRVLLREIDYALSKIPVPERAPFGPPTDRSGGRRDRGRDNGDRGGRTERSGPRPERPGGA